MAINKKLIHFKKFSDFNSKKLSANEANTQYTVGISGDVQNGNPDILYESIVWIKDTQQQWTHGQLYDGSKSDTLLNETDPVFSASPAASITEAKKTEWDNKADDSSVVHLSGDETITGVKTYRGRVNFLGDGDSNAMYLSTNTRLNVNGTTNTVLGFSAGTFLINNAAYTLTLRGKDPRPIYNGALLALYSDIPSAVTETTVSGWGFTKNPGTYSKPSGGIPKSDLANDVQTSLGKADNSLQIEIFGDMEITTLNGIAGGSTGRLYALPYESTGDEDDTLLSRTTVKTINGESILGSGDLTIEGGAKIYEWFYDGESESVTLSQEEYDNIVEADLVIVKFGMLSFTVSKTDKEFAEATGEYVLVGQFDFQGSKMYIQIVISIATKLATITIEEQAIPTKTSELENDSNFITSDGLKTINGESIVGSGDIAIQGGSGTITEVKANGTSVATSGVANIPAASTSAYGVTKLSSATNSTSTTLAATASAVKTAYDLANGKQDKLVSGTNIKTINGNSILGSGDITISGGSSEANIQAVDTGDVLDDVTVDYATKTYVDGLVGNINSILGDINSVLESIINS